MKQNDPCNLSNDKNIAADVTVHAIEAGSLYIINNETEAK